MVDGGRNGGRKAQENRRQIDQATIEGSLKPLRRDEMRRAELNRKESSKENIHMEEHKDWLAGYGDGKPTHPNDYLKQSKGF